MSAAKPCQGWKASRRPFIGHSRVLIPLVRDVFIRNSRLWQMFLHLSARPPTCAPPPFQISLPEPSAVGLFHSTQLIHALHPPRQSQRPTVTWWHEWLPVPYSCPVDQTPVHTHTHRTNKPHCCRHFTQTHLCLFFLNTSDFLESWHVEILNFLGWTWQVLLQCNGKLIYSAFRCCTNLNFEKIDPYDWFCGPGSQIKRLARNQNLHIAWRYLKCSQDNQIMMQLSNINPII